jgi:RecB family exonuclease
MDVGTSIHESIQRGLVALGAEVEVAVDWRPTFDLSGSADAVLREDDGTVTLVELKTTASLSYVRAAPKPEHLLQAGIYAMAPQIMAANIVIAYIDRVRFSVVEHTCATADTRWPVYREMARMMEAADWGSARGYLPPRDVPGHGIVKDPTGVVAPWNCRYCPYTERCVDAGP